MSYCPDCGEKLVTGSYDGKAYRYCIEGHYVSSPLTQERVSARVRPRRSRGEFTRSRSGAVVGSRG